MRGFLSTSMRGSIASIQPYAVSLRPPPPQVPCGSATYIRGLLPALVKKNSSYAIADTLRSYLLPGVLCWSLAHPSTEHGRPVAQHGLYQRTVADLSATIYVAESIAALESSDDADLDAVTHAIVVEEAWEAVARVLSEGYGRKVFTEGELNLFQDLSRMRIVNTALLTAHVERCVLFGKKAAGEIALTRLPHMHTTFQEDCNVLVRTINDLATSGPAMPRREFAICGAKLWATAVVLWRATHSQDQQLDSAYHEWILATKNCTQTCSYVRGRLAMTKALSPLKQQDAYSSSDVVPDFQTMNPLNTLPPKLVAVKRRHPKEEATAQE